MKSMNRILLTALALGAFVMVPCFAEKPMTTEEKSAHLRMCGRDNCCNKERKAPCRTTRWERTKRASQARRDAEAMQNN